MHDVHRYTRVVAACAALLLAGPARAAEITNGDVIKLLEAGMPEAVVLQAITSGQPRFDTSAPALILLKEKGASPAVLTAVLSAEKGATAAADASATRATSGLNPEEVVVVAGGAETPMQYLVPTMRSAVRGFGFGGVAFYAALAGRTAQRRFPAGSPEFLVSIPKNAQPAGYVTIASMAQRDNGTREVMTGGGYMSYSSGINKDRVVPIRTEPAADQARAREGFVLFRVVPVQPLLKGEYALVLYTAEIRTIGYFGQVGNSFFDFGID